MSISVLVVVVASLAIVVALAGMVTRNNGVAYTALALAMGAMVLSVSMSFVS